MANTDPTGDGSAIALTIPADQIRFLRGTFESALAGVHEELANYPKGLGEPTHLRREEVVYGRLLVALDGLVIVPDGDVRDVLSDLAGIIDRSNEYTRVVSEHEALHGLLGCLKGAGCQ